MIIKIFNNKRFNIIFIATICLSLFLFVIALFILKAESNAYRLKDLIKNKFPFLYSDLRLKIFEIDREIPNIGERLKLPLFHLVLSRKDIGYFTDLWEKFEDPRYGQKYYVENNNWRKASLIYNGKTYKIKIKSQSRDPSSHKIRNFVSYTIKLDNGEQINNARRFNLIIRERITAPTYKQYSLTPILSDNFNLLVQKEELVRVKINNGQEKLYYFEHRFDNDNMEAINKASFFRFDYSFSDYRPTDKSLIYTGIDNAKSAFNPEEFYIQFSKSFQDSGFPESYKEPIYNKYLSLNLTISEKRYQDIEQYFDLDYISSFEAARTIAGFNGHGFVAENLYVFYDTASGKFYPGFTRDVLSEELKTENGGTIEELINSRQPSPYTNWELRKIPLLHLFSQNNLIRQEKYKKIYKFITEDADSVIKRHHEAVEFNEKLTYFELLASKLRKIGIEVLTPSKNIIEYNVQTLKSYLKESKPEMTLSALNNNLIVEIVPQSMSAISFDKLILKNCPHSFQGTNKINLKLITFASREIVNVMAKETHGLCNQGEFYLTDAVSDFKFFTLLGQDSERVPSKYVLIFSFDKDLEPNLSMQNLDMSLVNTITGEKVIPASVTLQKKEIDLQPLLKIPTIEKQDPYMAWKSKNSNLEVTFTNAGELILHPGVYYLEDDLFIPKDLKLIIEPGTALYLGENKAIVCYKGIDIRGNKEQPVVITSIDSQRPFGSIAVLGDNKNSSKIHHLRLSGGSERWIDGVYFSGGLSLHYNKEVNLTDSIISNNKADDGINIKYSKKVLIENCIFEDNFADHIDLDYCTGAVIKSHFSAKNLSSDNGDGLDISGSKILVKENQFIGFKDKGLSIGEKSQALIYHNLFEDNLSAIAVKDLSEVYFLENSFTSNSTDINVYQKKDIFGGGNIYIIPQNQRNYQIKYSLDKKSNCYFFPNKEILEEFNLKINTFDIEAIFDMLQKVKFFNK